MECVFNCPVKILQELVKLIGDIKKAIRPAPRTGIGTPQGRWT